MKTLNAGLFLLGGIIAGSAAFANDGWTEKSKFFEDTDLQRRLEAIREFCTEDSLKTCIPEALKAHGDELEQRLKERREANAPRIREIKGSDDQVVQVESLTPPQPTKTKVAETLRLIDFIKALEKLQGLDPESKFPFKSGSLKKQLMLKRMMLQEFEKQEALDGLKGDGNDAFKKVREAIKEMMNGDKRKELKRIDALKKLNAIEDGFEDGEKWEKWIKASEEKNQIEENGFGATSEDLDRFKRLNDEIEQLERERTPLSPGEMKSQRESAERTLRIIERRGPRASEQEKNIAPIESGSPKSEFIQPRFYEKFKELKFDSKRIEFDPSKYEIKPQVLEQIRRLDPIELKIFERKNYNN